MKRIPVESSDISSIGYDAAEKVMEIEFKGERVYRYLDVPADIYAKFKAADSYGQFFNSFIHSYYRYRRVEDKNDTPGSSRALALVTGNDRKFRDMQIVASEFDFAIEQLDLDVGEIQSSDPDKIVVHKAKQAYKLAGDRPVLVNDAFWSITALRGFPGAYMKEVTGWFQPEDFLALMANKTDRSISLTDTVTYCDGTRTKTFSRVHWGMIVDQPRGKGLVSIDKVVVMQGETKTISEVEDDHGRSSVDLHETVWYDFAKWYNMQRKLRRI